MRKNQKLEQFTMRCKERGIKLTPQRLIIYEALISTGQHPSADEIYRQVKQQFPTISIDTIHRTLLTFCEIGVASRVECTGDPKRFDGNLATHHHLRCVQCGKIWDIYSPEYDQLSTSPDVPPDFIIHKKIVHIEGVCNACSQHLQEE